jgi:hypothetical protein
MVGWRSGNAIASYSEGAGFDFWPLHIGYPDDGGRQDFVKEVANFTTGQTENLGSDLYLMRLILFLLIL